MVNRPPNQTGPQPKANRAPTARLNAFFKFILAMVVLGGIGAALWFGGLMATVASSSDADTQIAFDRQRWMSEGSTGVRVLMVDDLTEHYLERAMHDSRILDLLGSPDFTLGQAEGRLADFDLVYYLGTTMSSLEVRDEWLVIKLNSRGELDRVGTVVQ